MSASGIVRSICPFRKRLTRARDNRDVAVDLRNCAEPVWLLFTVMLSQVVGVYLEELDEDEAGGRR